MVTLAQALNVSVVAEGIEDEQALVQLRELGVALEQGYYFAKPMPAHELPVMFLGSGSLIWQPRRIVPSLN